MSATLIPNSLKLAPLTTAPSSPVEGQIYLDGSVSPAVYKVWDGSAWQVFGSETPRITSLQVMTTYGPIANGVTDTVTFDTVVEDTFGFWNVSTNTFEPTENVKVQVVGSVSVGFAAGAGYTEAAIYYYDGGVTLNTIKSKYIDLEGYVVGFPINILSGGAVIDVLAGDTLKVTLYATPNSGGVSVIGVTSIIGGTNISFIEI